MSLAAIALVLFACGNDTKHGGYAGDVQPLFTQNGANWNDYVQGDITNATDTACDADNDTACIHAGEIRLLEIDEDISCEGVTAEDNIGAFDWTCDDSGENLRIISTGLKDGYGLANLIDFDVPALRENNLTVSFDGDEVYTTEPAVWWDNPVIANSTGGTLADEGTVYAIANSADGVTYELMANSISLVADEGVIINGSGAGEDSYVINATNLDYLWTEGMAINATGNQFGIYWHSVRFSKMKKVKAGYAYAKYVRSAGISLESSSNNSLSEISASNNYFHGILLSNCSYNELSKISVYNTGPGYGVGLSLKGVGLYLENVKYNKFSDVTVNNNNSNGLHIKALRESSSYNSFSGLTAKNNDGRGASLSGWYSIFSDFDVDGISIGGMYNKVYNINSDGSGAGSILSCRECEISNISSNYNGVYGFKIFYLDGSILTNVSASHNEGTGIEMHCNGSTGYGGVISNVTASNNGLSGIFFDGYYQLTIQNATINNNDESGIVFFVAADNSLFDITANNNGLHGIAFYSEINIGANNNILTDITTSNNGDTGVWLHGNAQYNTISELTANNNTEYGINIASKNNMFSNVVASNNWNAGLLVKRTTGNTLTNLSLSNNASYGMIMETAFDNTFTDIDASDNGRNGIYLYSASNNNRFAGITVSDNGHNGILPWFSSGNMFTSITANNNGHNGIYLYSSANNNTFSSVTTSNNIKYGVWLLAASNNTFKDLAVSNNSVYGVDINRSSNNYFTGLLKIGNNSTNDCYVSGGINPGLVDVTCSLSGLDGSNTYGVTNSSDATLTRGAGVTTASSFVDAANGDYSLNIDDSVIRDVLALSTGDDTLTHVWSGVAAQQADCDVAVPGSAFVTDHCESTVLSNAMEIQGDNIGNDDTLCESDETCLYTPNMGAYQGHGELISAGEFIDGVIFNVTLMKYESNGY